MYQCFHCMENTVGHVGDFNFEDFGRSGTGIVNVCHCSNCGAEILYFVSDDPEEWEDK